MVGLGSWKYVWKKKQLVIFELGLSLKPNHWETVANVGTNQFLRRNNNLKVFFSKKFSNLNFDQSFLQKQRVFPNTSKIQNFPLMMP